MLRLEIMGRLKGQNLKSMHLIKVPVVVILRQEEDDIEFQQISVHQDL